VLVAGAVLIGMDSPHPSSLADEGRRILFTFADVGIAVIVMFLTSQLSKRTPATAQAAPLARRIEATSRSLAHCSAACQDSVGVAAPGEAVSQLADEPQPPESFPTGRRICAACGLAGAASSARSMKNGR
jgi:hypothetical protein